MKKIWNWITGIFNRTKEIVVKYVQPSVAMVENIKMVIDSPVADLITAIIPGTLDDLIKDKMRKYLPIILQDLKIAQECSALKDPAAIVKCALEALVKYDKTSKYVYLKGIATKMADALTDGKISWSELEAMALYTYEQNYKKG